MTFKGKLDLEIKMYPILSFCVCPRDKSAPIEVRIRPQMHLSTVKVPIDFGRDWPWSSVSFFISNLLFSTKFCVSYSFASCCIYLMRSSPVSVPHPTWLRTYTDSYARGQGPTMDREAVCFHILVIPLILVSTRRLALDFTSCCRCSLYHKRFTCRHFICQHSSITETTVKPRPLAVNLFGFQYWESSSLFTSALVVAL